LVGDGNGRKLDAASSTSCCRRPTTFQPKISTNDRKKLDEYLESVRDIEKRIDRAGKQNFSKAGAPR